MQSSGAGTLITTSEELAAALRGGSVSGSGVVVNEQSPLGIAAANRCVMLISGIVANMPFGIKRRLDDRFREDAIDHPLYMIFDRRPNKWQKPQQFKMMMQMTKLLYGNAYALITRSAGRIIAITPLDPRRVQVIQNDDLSLKYRYRRKDGSYIDFKQSEIFHLVGPSLDGIIGVSPITYQREVMGASLAMEKHGANTFKNGAQVGGALVHPKGLSDAAIANIRASMDAYRVDGREAGKFPLFEEGLKFEQFSLSAADAQWIENRKFTRSEIAMFYGVPPHLIGDTENSSQLGSNVEQQTQAFVSFTLETEIKSWEDTINTDLLTDREADIYARLNRNSLIRGDIKARWDSYRSGLQWGVWSPNEIRGFEDENPRQDGDIYYPPPNMSGKPAAQTETGQDDTSKEGDQNVN